MQKPDAHAEVRNLCEQIATISKHDPRIQRLTDEIETITKAYLEPRDVLEVWEQWKLSTLQARVAHLLHKRLGMNISRDAIMNALYFDRHPDEVPVEKILNVTVCHINKKFTKHGAPYKIENVWGRGYKMVARETGISPSFPVDDTDILASRH